MPRARVVIVSLLVAGSLATTLTEQSGAVDGEIGSPGPEYTGAYLEPTGSKPQSKLWFHDGAWWGVLFSKTGARFNIFRLDPTGWVDTGVAVDTRMNSRSDALWDGTHLYLASHRYSVTTEVGFPARLLRYSYDGGSRSFVLDFGFPVQINNFKTETLVIDKDSTGTLWATWTQEGRVYVNRSLDDDRSWGIPFPLPVSGTTVDPDDISSLVAFNGRIGVMWGNQLEAAYYFTEHVDGEPHDTWQTTEAPLAGPGMADDHLNMAVDSSGRVWAVVKTGLHGQSDPLIVLLLRQSDGTWETQTVASNRYSHTRPIILLDEDQGLVHVLATGPQAPSTSGQAGGDIFQKSASMATRSFSDGYGTPIMHIPGQPLDNVTSTKQRLTLSSGLVALASAETIKRYWYAGSAAAEPTTTTTVSPTTTTTMPSNITYTMSASADGHVRKSKATANYATVTNMRVTETGTDAYRAYIAFDVPAMEPVRTAMLRLWVTGDSDDGGTVFSTSAAWEETKLTWATAPPPGIALGRPIGRVSIGTWVEVDVTTAVAAGQRVAFAIVNHDSDSAYYSSREGAHAPELVLNAR